VFVAKLSFATQGFGLRAGPSKIPAANLRGAGCFRAILDRAWLVGSSGDLIGSPGRWREPPSSGMGHFPLAQLQRFGCRVISVNNN